MNDKKKEYRINFRVSKRFKEQLKDFLDEKSFKLSDFCKQAIKNEMRKQSNYNSNFMKELKEMSQKLNGVKENMKDQKITLEKQAKKLEKTSKFDTYQDIEQKVKEITLILQEHRDKDSYKTYKYRGESLGCKTSEIIEKVEIPRREVWDILEHLRETNKIVKCRNGGWDLNE